MAKQNYDEYDCYIDPQKLRIARIERGKQQIELIKELGYTSASTISTIEKGVNRKRMNFGFAKRLANTIGVSYTKFVVLAPNQMTTLTKYCRFAGQTKKTKAENIAPFDEVNREAVPENQVEVNMQFGATPFAVIFKDASGRELKYVLSNEDAA